MKIYEIRSEVRKALEALQVDEETGEIIGTDLLDQTMEDAREKVANTARFIREEEADVEAMKKVIDDIKARMDTKKKRIEWLKHCALKGLEAIGSKVEEADIRVGTRKSTSVDVFDMDALPEEYRVEKVTVSANKTAIKNALKCGEVAGCRLVESLNLSIK